MRGCLFIFVILLGAVSLVNASATIKQTSVYVDGNLRSTQPNVDWSTFSEKPGWHTITVMAVNSNGIIGENSTLVLVDQR